MRMRMITVLVVSTLSSLCNPGTATTFDNDCPSSLRRDDYLTFMEAEFVSGYKRCFYFYLHTDREYDDAQKVCEQSGGNLVSLHRPEASNFVLKQLQDKYKYKGRVWIGLDDQLVETKYKWKDGNVLDESEYSHFAEGNGPRAVAITHFLDDCVALDSTTGKWYDSPCRNSWFMKAKKPFICEYRSREISTTTGMP